MNIDKLEETTHLRYSIPKITLFVKNSKLYCCKKIEIVKYNKNGYVSSEGDILISINSLTLN